jgi:hypothetical protein
MDNGKHFWISALYRLVNHIRINGPSPLAIDPDNFSPNAVDNFAYPSPKETTDAYHNLVTHLNRVDNGGFHSGHTST